MIDALQDISFGHAGFITSLPMQKAGGMMHRSSHKEEL
jgi:hypothetical protein